MILQLNPCIPVYVVSKQATGQAIGWLDYSAEHDLYWLVGLDSGGEIWILPNSDIRLQKNITLGRHDGKNAN